MEFRIFGGLLQDLGFRSGKGLQRLTIRGFGLGACITESGEGGGGGGLVYPLLILQ